MKTRSPRLARMSAILALLLPGLAARGGDVPAAAPEGAVTFNKDIAPLVFARCASCHRPGEVAPFSLLSYRDVSKRAEQVRDVTEGRIMPPWKAEPGFGHFADERRLTEEQVATIGRWVRAGTPEGEPADLPPAPKFAAGWQLGEPDMIVTMPEPYEVAAEGPDDYRCFVIPVRVPAGKYLRAAEYRPGNRKVVHHAVLATMPHEAALAKLAEGDGKSFASGLAPPGSLLPGQLAFWTPGMVPRPLPEGYAARWPEGSDLVLQLHLHPGGKPEAERSTLGFYFTDEAPRGRLKMLVMSNNEIDIAPGEADHAVRTSLTLKEPFEIHGIFPHMHLIGHSVRVTATLPDGSTEPLIAIGDWDFNWQHYYQYAKPLTLPAGTRIEGRWTYDNSEANPANPSRPPKRVGYGEQTTDEMAIMILDGLPAPPRAGPPAAEEKPGTR